MMENLDDNLTIHDHHRTRNETIVFLHGGNIASWMWHEQIEGLAEYRCLAIDLPGFGASNAISWTSMTETADLTAAAVRSLGGTRRVHIVGMSLGGLVTLRLIARHPDLVASGLVSGTNVVPLRTGTEALSRLQVGLWRHRWFWRAQARAFQIPAAARDRFVTEGMAIPESAIKAIMTEVSAGEVPDRLADSGVPILAIAGSREQREVQDSLKVLADQCPSVRTAVAPDGHHAWNAEQPKLFTAAIRSWVQSRTVHPGLQPSPGADEVH